MVALGIAAAAMLLLITVRKVPYFGVALRIGAIVMTSAVIIEALLVMPRWVSVETLAQGGAYIGQLAEVAYGDIILVTGTHGETCFQTEPGNSDALAATIREALDNPELREKVGAAGRERVKSQWSWRHTAIKTVEQYRAADARPARAGTRLGLGHDVR